MKNFRTGLIGIIVGIFIMIPITAYGISNAKIEALLYPDLRVLVNGEQIKLDSTPVVVEDRTYLPLRELGEKVMGMEVAWDQETKTASLTPKSDSIRQGTTDLTMEQIRKRESLRQAMAERRSEYFDYDVELDVDEIKILIQRIESEIRLEQRFLEDADKTNDPERFPPYLNEVVTEGMEQLEESRFYWQNKLADLQTE